MAGDAWQKAVCEIERGDYVKVDVWEDPVFVWYESRENETELSEEVSGKWTFHFSDNAIAASMCETAVEDGVVALAKHTNSINGVACFYINGDDDEAHRRVISFFLDNDLVRKTKDGRLFNIAFKFDSQTKAGEYGKDFKAKITLDRFVDLETGSLLE